MSENNSGLQSHQSKLKSVEELLFTIITDFANVSKENFNKKLEVIFSNVGMFLNINRISIFEYTLPNLNINKAHEWCNTNIITKIEHVKSIPISELSSELYKNHLNNQAYVIEDIHQLDQKESFFHLLNSLGIVSFLTEPLTHDSHCFGFICFEDIQVARHWNELERKIIKMLSTLITQVYISFSITKQIDILNDQINSSNKSQGEYLYKMSHDIRTPLGGIYNAVYLLGSTNLSIEQKDYLEIGQASADVMSSIIDGILDLSKIETGNMEVFHDSFNLEEELIRVYRTHKPLTDEKGLNLFFDFDYQINKVVYADYRKIRQIMHNLISNAIKYTHEGFVSIKTKLVINQEEPMIELEIADSGIGFNESELGRLQNIFEQNQERGFNRFQGSGLGLPLSYELVQLIGGSMTIQSTLHQGTSIKVILPVGFGQPYEYPFNKQYHALIISSDDHSFSKNILESIGIITHTLSSIKSEKCDLIFFEKEIKNNEEINQIKLKYCDEYAFAVSLYQEEQKKLELINLYIDYPVTRHNLYQKLIYTMSSSSWQMEDDFSNQSSLNGYALIVDDNRLNRIALESILTKEGMRSKSVSNGIKAIEAVKHESFDLVFMDVQMPDMDGIEATRRIRSLGKKYEILPIIAVTANAFLNDYDFMKSSLMDDIIFKPIRVKNLNLILRKFVKASRTIQIPEELFVFDQKDFETRFEGSFDIADEVIDSFLGEYSKDLNKIKKAILDKNVIQIIEATHYFKGSCSYLSGKRTVWLLSYMLDAAKRQSLDLMLTSYELLEKEVSQLLDSIVEYKGKIIA